jgi:hypothetical protein
MTKVTASPEQVAKWIGSGIKDNLEELIKAELQAHVDPIISKLARELAASTAVRVDGYYSYDFPSAKVFLSFNNSEVTYEDERTAKVRDQHQGTSSNGSMDRGRSQG